MVSGQAGGGSASFSPSCGRRSARRKAGRLATLVAFGLALAGTVAPAAADADAANPVNPANVLGALAAATPSSGLAPALVPAAASDPGALKLSVSDFTKLATSIGGLSPRQTSSPAWSEVFNRTSQYYTPANPASGSWVHVQGQANRDTQLSLPSSLRNKAAYTPLYSFRVSFPQPVADPKLNISVQAVSWYYCYYYGSCPTLYSTLSSKVAFSGARTAGGPDALRGIRKVSGIDSVPSSRYRIDGTALVNDGFGCFQNGTSIAGGIGSLGCYNNASYSSQARGAVGSGAGDLGYDLAGTIQLDTGGQPVTEVTVTQAARFAMPTATWSKVTTPSISLSYAGSTPVSSDNLQVGKSVVSGQVARPGESVAYRLDVANTNGQPTSGPVTLIDRLPAQLSDPSLDWSPTVGTAAVNGDTLTWTIPAGSTAIGGLQVRARVRDGATSGLVTNTATLSGLCGANCTASATSRIVSDPADLRVAKQGPAQVPDGATISYQVSVTNGGGLASDKTATVVDSLPAGIDPASVTATVSYGTVAVSGSTLTWTLPAGIAPSDPRPVRMVVTGTVSTKAGTTLTNIAHMVSGQCTGACTAIVTTQVTDSGGRVTLTKRNNLGPAAIVRPGQQFTYTITATNSGKVSAAGVRLSDTLPAGLLFASSTQPGWTVSGRDAQSDPFDLAPGQVKSLTLFVQVGADGAQGQVLRNAVVVQDGPSITECFANSTLQGCAVDPSPPTVSTDVLTVQKQSDIAPGQRVSVGQVITYTISVGNTSPYPARNVVIADQLPSGLSFDPASQPGWRIGGRMATSDAVSVDAHSSITLSIRARVATATAITQRNVAVITQYTLGGGVTGDGARLLQAVDLARLADACAAHPTTNGCAYADVQTVNPGTGSGAPAPQAGPTPSATPSRAAAPAPSAVPSAVPTAPAPTAKPQTSAPWYAGLLRLFGIRI